MHPLHIVLQEECELQAKLLVRNAQSHQAGTILQQAARSNSTPISAGHSRSNSTALSRLGAGVSVHTAAVAAPAGAALTSPTTQLGKNAAAAAAFAVGYDNSASAGALS